MTILTSLENLRNEKSPIIVFGAGIAGEALVHACEDAGFSVECVCDNNINKTRGALCGKRIVHVPELPRLYPEAVFLISAADLKDVVEQLTLLGYSRFYSGSELLRNFNIGAHSFGAPFDFVEYAVATCLQCHDAWLQPDKVFLRSVDVIVTERCTQRCRDCSNLMQYYTNPQNCDIKEIFQDLDSLLAAVDGINEFRIIGGEPLVNRNFHLVVQRLSKENKVRRTVIYTNGTLLPEQNQLPILKDPKVLFIITDYGPASKQLEKLKVLLKENEIPFYVTKAGGWSDCSRIGRHNRTAEQMREVFRGCCAKNTLTLTKGRLFRCPFSANVYRLGAAPNYADDYVEVSALKRGRTIPELKKELRELVTAREFLHVCEYCNGRPFGAPEIPPGVQAPRPLPY